MPRKTDSANPADWVFLAKSDLEGVRRLADEAISFPLCQSKLAEILEKVIKAELIRRGWFLLKTHDLVKLLDELRERDESLADEVQSLAEELAEVYFTNRYPGFDLEDADWISFRKQIGDVTALLEKVERRVLSNDPAI